MNTWKAVAGIGLVLLGGVASKALLALVPLAACPPVTVLAGRPPVEQASDPAGESGPPLETFVLTPIRSESFSLLVPAEIRGPLTNNSCRNWDNRAESCYLPAGPLEAVAGERPELASVLERHLSGELGAWKPGCWPSDGHVINVALEQYASLEQIWLSYRMEVHETVGACWLRPDGDPFEQVKAAASQPAAQLRVEAFGGTRSATGYPRVVHF